MKSSVGPTEVQFAGSRDSLRWHRYDRAAYAAPGVASPFKKNVTFMGTGMVVRGDEIWQYGTEYESAHGDTEARKRKTDGFTDLLFGNKGGFNYAFVERIEHVKGPAGILYGQHTPGGMLNLVSKRPLAKPRTKVGAMAGSYGFYRGDIDTSGLIGAKKKLSYRLAASYMLTHGPLNHPGEKGDGALFYNANETFIPMYTLDQRLTTFGQKFPNRVVSISEFGVKVDLLKSRLVATASVYDMAEDNVILSQVDEDGTVTGVTNHRNYRFSVSRTW